METPTPKAFFSRHAVFHLDEFRTAYETPGHRSPQTTSAVLKQHVAAGRLVHVRREIYARVPEGELAGQFQVDPYLVASRLAKDAVIAYHAALQLLGKAHSISSNVNYLTAKRAKPFAFQGTHFIPTLVPTVLRSLPDFGGGIREEVRNGVNLRVTNYERTLVDVLDAPDYGGGWEEIWRSLESIEFFNLDFVVEYALKLNSALTIARVGFFLEQHRDALMVEERHLQPLRARAPKRRQYFERRKRKGGKLVHDWNLIVPQGVLDRSWQEVA
jgi:predicted transcriptional regulator of viral defense system